MRLIAIAFALTSTILGCGSPIEPSSHSESTESVAPVTPTDELAGTYCQSGGFDAQFLTLKKNGTFTCEIEGCLGNFGSTSGTWVRLADRITVATTKSSEFYSGNAIGDIKIVRDNGKIRLLTDADADRLKNKPDLLQYFYFDRYKPD